MILSFKMKGDVIYDHFLIELTNTIELTKTANMETVMLST